MADTKNTILQGRIFPPLMKFTLPLMLISLLQAMYGAVDLFVVGRYGGTISVSAVSNGSQIMQTVTNAIIGFTTGVTVLAGTCFGAGDSKGTAKTAGAIAKLFSVVAALLTAFMLVFAENVVHIMRVPEEAVKGAVTYVRICSAGLLFTCGFNALSAFFRGIGDSRSPLYFIVIACVLNIGLDFLFCGVFGLDIAGAAIATVLAQAASFTAALIRIKGGRLPVRVTAHHFRNNGSYIKRMIRLGAPLGLQELLFGVSFLIVLTVINDFGVIASASIGIVDRLFMFLAILPISFSSSLSAFVAQNTGARQKDRAIKATALAAAVSTAVGIGMAALTYFAGGALAALFDDNPQVIGTAAAYLKVVSVQYMLIPIDYCLIGYFNGIGKSNFVMIEGVVTAMLVRVPLSYIFSRLPGADISTIAIAIPIAALFSLIACLTYFIYLNKKRPGRPKRVLDTPQN